MNENTINNDVTMAGESERALLASRYRIIRQLGQGGMGSVWLAEDTQLDGKLFAIKMLPSILVLNKRAYNQLKSEALVAMKLVHPNIVQIRAFEENNGNPFLVMDYIDGQTLDDWLGDRIQDSGVSEDEIICLLKPIAEALDYAHTEGVVHRDVKPANVMIRKDGRPFIMDFGIAREIQETMTRVTGKLSSGTLLYMSPEQLRGQPPKAAQDVYSFAAMAYECLKGEPPFSRGQIEYQILNEQPERLSDDIRISASIMRGLSKTPEARPDSCVKVLLTPCPMRQMPAARPQVSVSPRLVAPMTDRIVVRPKRNIVGIVLPLFCLIVSLLVLGGVLWHREAKRQEDARRLAVEQQQEELRRRQAEDKRKAQEAAARKKTEAERLAKLKQEEAQRKAEEEAKRREAEKQAKERELARQKDEEARKAAEAEKAAIAAREKAETDTAMVLQRGKRALALLAIDPLQYESVSMDLTKEQRDLLSPVFKEIVKGEASLEAFLSLYTLNHPEVRIHKKAQEDRIASFKMTVEMLRSGKLSGAGQQSDRMQLPPTMQVTAKVNGEEMSGAILNDGSKDFNLPVKWTLARGKKYGPYSVMCQRNGIRYVGTFAQVTADWQGEKNVSVELSRNENKSQKELLPFYFQTCTPIPNGRHRFTFRDNKGRKDPYGNVMVYSVLKGEEIGKSGFIVTGYENKTKTMVVPGSGSKLKRTVDVSTVEITRLSDGYKVNLLIGDRQCYVPVEWTLHRGKIYGPYRVSCERGGSQYEGKLERTSSTQSAVVNKIVAEISLKIDSDDVIAAQNILEDYESRVLSSNESSSSLLHCHYLVAEMFWEKAQAEYSKTKRNDDEIKDLLFGSMDKSTKKRKGKGAFNLASNIFFSHPDHPQALKAGVIVEAIKNFSEKNYGAKILTKNIEYQRQRIRSLR